MAKEIDIYDAKNLNTATVRKFLKGGGQASDDELAMLLAISRNQNMNPFMKEVYFVKYKDSPAQIVVSRDFYRKRAMANPNFAGIEVGVIVQEEDGSIKKLDGAFKTKNQELVGAWARVHLKNHEIPYFPENKLVMFGSENPGESIFGVTPEESRLLAGGSNDYTIGNIFATVYESGLDPVGTWTKAAGTALPSFPEADNVFQATVLAEG